MLSREALGEPGPCRREVGAVSPKEMLPYPGCSRMEVLDIWVGKWKAA